MWPLNEQAPLRLRTLHISLAQGIVIFTYGAIVVLSTIQVLSRYLIGNSVPWTEEMARYCFMWLIYVGIVIALNRGTHASAGILSGLCKGSAKHLVEAAIHSISLALFAVLFFHGLELFFMVKGQTSPAMRISMMIPYASLPFGCVLMVLEECFLLAGIFRAIKGGNA